MDATLFAVIVCLSKAKQYNDGMDKTFTTEELAEIKRMIERIFVPIQGRAQIVPCVGTMRLTMDAVEVPHYFYQVMFTSNPGNAEIRVGYPNLPNISLAQYAWIMSVEIYWRLTPVLGNQLDALEERLWPTANGHLPDYGALEHPPTA